MSKPKSAKPPALPPPIAIQEVQPETGEAEKRAIRRKSGFAKTIITGALSPTTGKKTRLG